MDKSSSRSLGIVLVNYMTPSETTFCINRILSFADLKVRTVVVDNSPAECDISRAIRDHESVEVIRDNENRGYAAAANIGIRTLIASGEEFILVMNTDVDFDERDIKEVLRTMQSDARIWVAGPTLLDLDKGSRTVEIQSMGQKINSLTCKACRNVSSEHVSKECVDVQYVSGAAMFLRSRSILNAGYLDENFFLYYEETEFCFRIARRFPKARIVVVPGAKMWHEQGTSTSGTVGIYYGTRSKVQFHRTYYPFFHLVFILYTVILGGLRQGLQSLNDRNLNLLLAWMYGVWDGLTGVRGRARYKFLS